MAAYNSTIVLLSSSINNGGKIIFIMEDSGCSTFKCRISGEVF